MSAQVSGLPGQGMGIVRGSYIAFGVPAVSGLGNL